jgi:sulfate permease, SulP family
MGDHPAMPRNLGDQLARLRASSVWFASFRGYQRSWVAFDLVAGLTLLAIAVPEQLATSRLAGMPPITGYYAFIAGTVMFALLGSSPQVSVGADSTIAPLFALAIAPLAVGGPSRYVELVAILSVAVGVLVVIVWLLRLGWVAEFLSAPIITGFLAGIAVIIVVHQLPDLLGLPPAAGSTLHRLGYTLRHLDQTNGWSFAIGAGVFAITLACERVDRRLPGALIGLIVSTLLVAVFDLQSHGVAVLGTIAHGTPRFGLHGLSVAALGKVAPIAGVVAVVVVTQSAATTRAFADHARYEVNVGRDFLGVGAGNILAGFAGGFPVNASPPRTAAVVSASGRTQLAGLIAATAVIALIPVTGLLQDLPLATLAGVLVYIAIRIFHLSDLIAIRRFDLFEFGLALVTLLTIALVGVEAGIAVAVGLAILDRTRLSARAHLHLLGRIPNTTSWAPLSRVDPAAQLPGVVVVLFATPLWYANATQFRTQLHDALTRANGPVRLVVLDAIGMADIDYTGSRALGSVLDELDRRQIKFAVARAGQRLRNNLAHTELARRIGDDHFFPTVDQAVSALNAEHPESSRA